MKNFLEQLKKFIQSEKLQSFVSFIIVSSNKITDSLKYYFNVYFEIPGLIFRKIPELEINSLISITILFIVIFYFISR